MDIKRFYQHVSDALQKGGHSLFDKLKLDNSDLVNAVKNSDPVAVAESLNAWVNPNKPDGLERYALPLAVDNNHELIVGMLLMKKANPDVRAKDGETALYKAVFWENENIVRLLLDKGATPTFPNLSGKTPIQAAKESGYKNILALLTNDKAELKRIQIEKDLATHSEMKAKAQQAKASKLRDGVVLATDSLTPKMEEFSAQDDAILEKYGKAILPMEALIKAIKEKDSHAVKYYTPKVEDLNQVHEGDSPLQLAIVSGKEKLAIYLLDHEANLFVKDQEGNYPLLNNGVQHQLYDLLKIALSKEENSEHILNDPNQSFSAQFLAYKDPKMMNMLLDKGADPFFGGKDGQSPILKAIQKGSIAILPVLAKHKVPFDKKIDGKSCLQWAIELNKIDWVNGLITEKALANADPNEIEIIQQLAENHENSNMKAILKAVKL
jgi:ankyrin repeat protein